MSRGNILFVIPFAALFIAMISIGCSDKSKCLEFELLQGQAEPPSNIRLFFGVETCDGEPMPGITAGEFIIREDGDVISQYESQQTILPTSMGFDMVSVLLLDMSGSIIDSGNLTALQGAARSFIERVAGDQEVAIYTFDGREDMQLLVDFSRDASILIAGIDSLSSYSPVDPSTNLNGAILAGLFQLDQRVELSTATMVAGSMVVFTDGTDQAGRVDDEIALNRAERSDHSVFTIGLGGEIDRDYLNSIGKDGSAFASNASGITDAFNTIAEKIQKASQKFYILSYCSPKRAGAHSLTLQVDGYTGRLSFTFYADDFGPGCNPSGSADASTDSLSDAPGDPFSDIPLGALGDPCDYGRDCSTGVCIHWVDVLYIGETEFPGGYCTSVCEPYTDDCGASEYCMPRNDDSSGYCLRSCESDLDCRTSEGYECNIILRSCVTIPS